MTFKPKIVKNLTLPLLKQKEGETVFIAVQTEIVLGKELKGNNPEKKKPAFMMQVIDLADDTGEVMQYITTSVVKSTLEEEYPNGSYVGKAFAVEKHPKQNGKEYFPFTIKEIENPLAVAAPAAKKDKAA